MITVNDIQQALSITDKDVQVKEFARIFRLLSEDLLVQFVKFNKVDNLEDGSIVVRHPNGFDFVLAQMDVEGTYECGIYLDETFIRGGFSLLNEADIIRIESLFD